MPSTDHIEKLLEDEDNLGFSFPDVPSQLRGLPNDAFFRLWRKLAFAGKYPFDRMVEHELRTRMIVSMTDFKKASDRASRVLIALTVVLVVLTGVLVWLTFRLNGQ